MSLTDQLCQIKNSIAEAERELTLLNSGRKVSASRARKQLQNVKNQSQLLRKAVIAHTKELPTKKRPVKAEPEKSNFVCEMPEPEMPKLEPAPQVDVPKPKKKRITKPKKSIIV
jgi:hypothetical protein